MMQSTFVILKPEALERGLVGRIVSRFEDANMEISYITTCYGSEARWREHYIQHADQPWLEDTIKYLQEKLVIALLIEGEDVVSRVRNMAGGSKLAPGTIRGDFAENFSRNCVHTAETEADAMREEAIWIRNTTQ